MRRVLYLEATGEPLAALGHLDRVRAALDAEPGFVSARVLRAAGAAGVFLLEVEWSGDEPDLAGLPATDLKFRAWVFEVLGADG